MTLSDTVKYIILFIVNIRVDTLVVVLSSTLIVTHVLQESPNIGDGACFTVVQTSRTGTMIRGIPAHSSSATTRVISIRVTPYRLEAGNRSGVMDRSF